MLSNVLQNDPISISLPSGSISLPYSVATLIQLDDYLASYIHSPKIQQLLATSQLSALAQNACLDLVPLLAFAARAHEKVDFNSVPGYVAFLDRLFEFCAKDQLNAVLRFLKPKKSDTVLEVGCFTGRLCLLLAKHVKHMTGIDNSAPAIELAKSLASKTPNCTFINGMFPQSIEGQFDKAIWFGPQPIKLNLPAKRSLISFRPLPTSSPVKRAQPEKRDPLSEQEQKKYGSIPQGCAYEVYFDKTWPSLGELYQPVIVVLDKT